MRQQSSMEFVLTYSWALLILGVFVATVAIISLSHPVRSYIPSQCTITPLFQCLDSLFAANTLTVVFQNNLGQALYFPSNAFNATITGSGSETQYGIGECVPSFLPVGGEAVCDATVSGAQNLPMGSQLLTSFLITYEICNGGSFASCTAPTYKTAGSSLQAISPSGTSLYSITFHVGADASYGTIVLNGVSYPDGDTAYFVSRGITIYALPAAGHAFVSWSVTPSSTVESTASQNTVLSLSSNTVLTATFT